jgi:hypothetical protein
MGKVGLHTIDTSSQIPTGLQLDLCRELALAFRDLCRVVCDRFGHEGEQLIKDLFLSDAHFPHGDAEQGKENSTKTVNVALIKLLATRSMGSDAGGTESNKKNCPP